MVSGPAVEIRGQRRIMRKLAPQYLLGGPVADLVNRLATWVQREARKGAKPHPGDRGELARSIRTDLASTREPLGSMSAKVAPRKSYAWPVEKGRLPGRMPPSDVIADWLRRHGSDPRLGFVVARAIGRRGTKGLHYMENALKAGRSKAREFAPAAARAIGQRWRAR